VINGFVLDVAIESELIAIEVSIHFLVGMLELIHGYEEGMTYLYSIGVLMISGVGFESNAIPGKGSSMSRD
jgi:hypothetical protein